MEKSEQRKKEDRELIERFCSRFASNSYFALDVIIKRSSEFIKSENLEAKPKLELNRWIVDSNSHEWMIYLDGEDGRYYCIDPNGKWIFREHSFISNTSSINNYNEHSKYRYATDEEILERLSKIAVKMGYKERQSECFFSSDDNENIDFNNSSFEVDVSGCLWIANTEKVNGWRNSNCIFKDGKWAKFIETDTERIERLEKRVKELENKNK